MLLSLHSDLIVPSQSIKEDTPFEAEFARRYCGMITPPEAEWLRRSCGICIRGEMRQKNRGKIAENPKIFSFLRIDRLRFWLDDNLGMMLLKSSLGLQG